MLSFIKKLLRIKPSQKKKVYLSNPQDNNDFKKNHDKSKSKSKATIISRENHRVSKTNISVNALKVLNRLHSAGYEACLVGGGVRDLLLGISPKDFDVATNAKPNEVNRLFRNSMLIGQRFRIVHVQFYREIIEVTTFRAGEHSPLNAEKTPRRFNAQTRVKDKSGMIIQDNIYGDINQDAWRRDFTVNALYYNIADFSIVDFTGGYQDIKNKVIRLIGDPDTRYQEDPVRMLRAIRFCAKLNFTLDRKTAEPIKRLAHLIKNIPSARLSEEIFKVYQSGASQQAHRLLCEHGLFPYLFPQTSDLLKTDVAEHVLIQEALEDTDCRFADKKPLMPAFLLAALLWHPLQKDVETFIAEGDLPLMALDKAMAQVVHTQNQAVAIPKKHWQVVREIWLLQYRFPRRQGPRPARLLTHPRFRAAFDFLLIRALAEEVPIELADWWTTFQEVDPVEQDEMVKAIEAENPPKFKKKRK